MAQSPQVFSALDALASGDGAGQDLWAVGTPAPCAQGQPPPGYTCGSVVWGSTDGGASWTALSTAPGWTITRLDFTGPRQGWAVAQPAACPGSSPGCADALWLTTDGGTDWTTVAAGAPKASASSAAPVAAGFITAFYALNSTDAWVVRAASAGYCSPPATAGCSEEVLATSNGGRTWVQQYQASYAGAEPIDLLTAYAPEAGQPEAWLLLGNDQVLRLQGGGSWQPAGRLAQPAEPPGPPEPVGGNMQFLNAEYGWLTFCDAGTGSNAGCVNDTYRTTDGGRSWTLLQQEACVQWTAIDMRTTLAGTLVAGGVGPGCQGPAPTPGNTVLQTADGGATWQRAAAAPGAIAAAAFGPGALWTADILTCPVQVPLRCPSAILQLVPGAASWRQLDPSNVPDLPDEALVDGRLVGLAAGIGGAATVLGSAQGAAWAPVGRLPPASGSWYGGLTGTPAGPLAWLIAGCDAAGGLCALTSGDGGRTWSQEPLGGPTLGLRGLVLTAPAGGWAVGQRVGCNGVTWCSWPFQAPTTLADWQAAPGSAQPLNVIALAAGDPADLVAEPRCAEATVGACPAFLWTVTPSGLARGSEVPAAGTTYAPAALATGPGRAEVVAAASRTGGALFIHTADSGWREVVLPGLLVDRIAFAGSGFGLLGTQHGRFFVTNDGGGAWTQIA